MNTTSNSKLAIVTITVGARYESMAEITHPTIEAYAKKVGADFIVWRTFQNHSHPAYQKLEIASLLEEYDRVLYIDTDIIIRDDAPNLFDIVPEDTFGAFNEFAFTPRIEAMKSFVEDLEWIKGGKYFNTGVFVCSKAHKGVFRQPIPEIDNFYEQTYLNYMLHVTRVKTAEIQHRFNRMSCMDKYTGEPRYDSYFMHFAGVQLPDEEMRTLIAADLEVWKKHEGKHHYPKNIYINAQGGIGDLVASEPIIRHMREKFYKDANMVIQTHHPELFDHMEGVKFHKPSTVLKDVGFKEFDLMPQGAHVVNSLVIHALCHPTDYASLMMMKGQISNLAKRIKLSSEGHSLLESEEEILHRSVLIHAGKGWESKTFPKEFWQGVVDGLISKGIPVALIGKTVNDKQGFVEIDGTHCLDLRDKLSIKSLIRAIELAPVLLSNDSSPIHIGGAFNNWIGLLGSCKEPFRIMPYRNGLQGWRAANLTSGIIEKTYDPTHPYFVGINTCEPEDIQKILPEPQTVAEWAARRIAEMAAKP